MPTNPRWVEHTERAAWDTVQTLRQEIERERRHVERLTRLQPAWPRVVEALDRVRERFSFGDEEPAVMIERLAARVQELEKERDELSQTLVSERGERERERVLAGPEAPRPASGKVRPAVRWFADLLHEKSLTVRQKGRRDPAKVIAALELEVEGLAHARQSELLELAVNVGHLAMLLARAVRSRQRFG
ncbi:MAG: hypothetical protein KC776_21760 [Myxococcales bacterium]|nr:hypothetical protein [Myxococcales bacterium]MCB9582753.1 hypothetical protein [Polyangiaceae bacterium]